MVRDLDSKNGIFLHGVRVREAEVLPGDCLTLGRTEITLCFQQSTAGEDSVAGEVAAPTGAPAPAALRPTTGRTTTEQLLY